MPTRPAARVFESFNDIAHLARHEIVDAVSPLHKSYIRLLYGTEVETGSG